MENTWLKCELMRTYSHILKVKKTCKLYASQLACKQEDDAECEEKKTFNSLHFQYVGICHH
jgi:hypothetical protein